MRESISSRLRLQWMKGLLYAACSLPVTLIGAAHEGVAEPKDLEEQPTLPCMTMYPEGMLSIEKRFTPYFLDPLFFSSIRLPRISTECAKHPVSNLKHSLSCSPSQGGATAHVLLPSLKEPFITAKEKLIVSPIGATLPIPEYILPVPSSTFFSIPQSTLLSALANNLASISLFNSTTEFLNPPQPAPLISELTPPVSQTKFIPEPAPVVVPVPEPAPVVVPVPEPAPVVVPVPEPAPVVVPVPEPAPVVVPTPEPAPVVVPNPEPAPVVVPTPEPAPVETPKLFQSRSVDASFTTREKTPAVAIQKAGTLEEQVRSPILEKEETKGQATKPSTKSEETYPLYEKDPKIFFGKTIAAAEDVQLPPRDQRAQGHLINFRNAPMSDYIRFVASLTNNNFIYREEDVQFFVSVVSKEPTSIENVIHALLQELRIHGLALLQQENNFIIYPALGPLSPAQLISPEGPNPEIGTRIFQMKYVSARSVQAIMTRMLSEQAIAQVIVESNSLLITDLSINIERAAQIIEAIDTLSAAFDMGQYVAVNNRIEDLIPLAEKILDPLSGGGMPPIFVIQSSTNSAFIIGSSGLVTQSFAVLDRLDGREGTTGIFDHAKLIELGRSREQAKALPRLPGTPGGSPTPSGLPGEPGTAPGALGGGLQEAGAVGAARERARILQEELENQGDVLTNTPEGETVARGTPVAREPSPTIGGRQGPPPPPRTKFYIYKLDFRKGDQLIAALLSIAESLSYDQTQNKLLLDAINSVQWIESSNSIIITGTYEAIIKVKDLIQELDTPLKQVLLEMLVLDTSLSESIAFSVDTINRLNDVNLSFAQGYIAGPQGSQFNSINNGVVATTGPFDSTPLASVQGFNLGIIGRHICHNGISFGSIGALIRALHTDTTTNVVLNPKIVVEDNFPAAIFVGQNTAFQTQSIANNNGNILTNNVEYRDVGTSLKVTPQIGNGNIITLLIDQEVSAVVSTTGGGQAGGTQAVSIPVAQTTNKATTVTKIHVPDGYFVILSGMLRDEKQFSRSQMPCLGGIPFLGALFSSKSDTITKRNYLIFIRPKIVECEVYLEETRRQQDIFELKNKRRPRWKYEADEALDFLNLPRFNEPNDSACTPFGSLGPCQSCGACSFGNCSGCGSEGCCTDCGFCGCCECD